MSLKPKVITVLVVLVAGLMVFDYSQNHPEQIAKWTQSLSRGEVVENLHTEIFTPGGLRAKIESINANLTAKGVVEQTNQHRLQFGKMALKENAYLNQMALLKVQDMFANQYFEHISPTGKGPADLAKQTGYAYISVGENLALGNYKDDAELVEAWMNSPGHRANILNGKFTEIGVAVLKGKFEGKTTWLAVQEFGRPVTECPKVDEFLKSQIDSNTQEINELEQQVNQAKMEIESAVEPTSKEELNSYNQKVEAYNALIKVFNNRIDQQKDVVFRFNSQVKAFNECIGE